MRAALIVLLGTVLALPALAQTTRGESVRVDQAPDPRGTFSLMVDNDLFAGTDKNYTSGFQLDWRSPSYDPPRWLSFLTDRRSLIFPEGGTPRWGISFGQNVFTPSDTMRTTPDPKDRPYAAFLFGSLSLASYTATSYGSMELQMGIVGPGAWGRQAQNGVHRAMNIDIAHGWAYQLKDELGVNAILARQWRWNYETGIEGLQYGFVPSLNASLGNVYTYASGGMMVRLGSNLDADFGPPRTRPAQSGSAFFNPGDDRFGWYVFAGVEGRAVARNIFLDGNTWRDGPHVTREPLVGDLNLGFALMWKRTRLTATYTARSREFTAQGNGLQYGSLAVAFRF